MSTERQRVERVPGSRRARLTPAPGTDPTPDTTPTPDTASGADAGQAPASGPNDERLRSDVPPHY